MEAPELSANGLLLRGWAAGTGVCFVFADADNRYAGSIDLRLSRTDPLLAERSATAAGAWMPGWARWSAREVRREAGADRR